MKRRVVFVSKCMLNTNVMIPTITTPKKYPGNVTEPIVLILNNKVGIEQMECPEKIILGWPRSKTNKTELSKNQEFVKECERIADEVIKKIKDYLKNDVEVSFILGKRGSPSCGFLETHKEINGEVKLVKGSGVFIDILREGMKKEGIDIPIIDFEHEDVDSCLGEIKKKLTNDY